MAGVSAFPMPDPTRPNGSARFHPGMQEQSAFAPAKPVEQWRTIIAQLRARASGVPQPPQPGPPTGTTTTTTAPPPAPPASGLWPPRSAPGPLPSGVPGGMVGAHSLPAHGGPPTVGALGVLRRPIVPAFAQQPGRIIGVPRGSVRSQLSRGPRPGRSTAFHDYTGSSVGSESGHYARVKGFTS